MHQSVTNPATLEPLGEVPVCGSDEVREAVAAACSAQPGWQDVPAPDRATLLREIGARIRARTRELATLMTRESGKPLCESIDCIGAVATVFETCGSGVSLPPRAGVVAAIVPFNFPLMQMACMMAPALAAGNALVCKPPHQDPLACLQLAAACDPLPTGVVNVVTGGPDAGRALVDATGVDVVMFTGSAAAGRSIAAAAQRKRVDLEIGSVGALIVCRDANLDIAVPGIAWTRLRNAGQGCGSGKHLYVERSIAAEFVERMHQCIGFLDVDDPAKPPTDIGPLISLEAAHRVEDQVGRSLREGAKLILGGRRFRPSGLPGHFFQPTILTDVRAGSVPTREEIMGPVITITPVADAADAIRLAIESPFSADAAIYTADPQAIIEAVERVKAGAIRICAPREGVNTGPFDCMVRRGMRRALDAGVVDPFAPSQRVHIADLAQTKPWWFPYSHRKIR
ncbi:MAG: aldehyde dehydrogenase family protein [Steroidobacterales bacterium]